LYLTVNMFFISCNHAQLPFRIYNIFFSRQIKSHSIVKVIIFSILLFISNTNYIPKTGTMLFYGNTVLTMPIPIIFVLCSCNKFKITQQINLQFIEDCKCPIGVKIKIYYIYQGYRKMRQPIKYGE